MLDPWMLDARLHKLCDTCLERTFNNGFLMKRLIEEFHPVAGRLD